jgi:catechol 2,3-dioxygenase-like lactoylglutathione lyase family enzyme
MADIEGLHHVTAIAGEPQANINFYTGVLGLRLVKLTVNFDDPTTYHLYYGDGQGHPGTIMTFFPWPGALKGSIGTGQLTVTSFAVPEKSLPYWRKRLHKNGVEFEEATSDFGEETLFLRDPDGLQLELISSSNADPDHIWDRGPVPTEHAIRGFHHVTLSENGHERTVLLLTERGEPLPLCGCDRRSRQHSGSTLRSRRPARKSCRRNRPSRSVEDRY